VDCALVAHDLSQSRLDDPGSDELGADAIRCSSRHPHDHLVLVHSQQLDTARVALEEGIENLLDDPLHRFAHGWSMRNCAPKRKQS